MQKKLSIPRLILATFLAAGVVTGIILGFYKAKESTPTISVNPWFSEYVDVTAVPRYPFEQYGSKVNQKNIVLSFIVSSKSDACTPTWGGTYTLDQAGSTLDLDRRIARFRQLGGDVVVSFGGQLNDELSVKCIDKDKLLAAYESVVNRYGVDTIDLDIEGSHLTDYDSITRLSKAVSELQKKKRSDGMNLAVWLTLPVSTQGLTINGANTVSQMLNNGVDLAGVNAMTMDYGASKSKDDSMAVASEKALNETHRQLSILFNQAGIYLNDASIWGKIGATPMIGQNDIYDEIFTLDDAKDINDFAKLHNISRLSMWSGNRDIECGENYVNVNIVSDSCSGVKQDKFAYAVALGKGFDGDISGNSAKVTVSDPKTEELPDDPTKSPYQIWSDTNTYLEGTKVVWHHNVYQAKWWTKGDLPDNPVLQSYQTPWQLVGPVLPNETPIPQATLRAGTYPEWLGTEIYDAGQRILFDGVPYEAKWWTQGDSPAASNSNPDSSPWKRLTQTQIEEILRK